MSTIGSYHFSTNFDHIILSGNHINILSLIFQGITLGVATIAAGVGLFVEAACIPIIGIVCAIIGLALAIASLFIHRDPPKPKPTAVDNYVSGAGATFANGLKSPSAAWLSDYHKKHPST